jgi:hypothetical protein
MMPAKPAMRIFSPWPLLTPSDSNVAGGRHEPARQKKIHRMANELCHMPAAAENFYAIYMANSLRHIASLWNAATQ